MRQSQRTIRREFGDTYVSVMRGLNDLLSGRNILRFLKGLVTSGLIVGAVGGLMRFSEYASGFGTGGRYLLLTALALLTVFTASQQTG